jgi:hypothetical protein
VIAEQLMTQLQSDTNNPDYKVAADFLSDLKARIATGSADQSPITPPAAQQNGALQNQDLPNVTLPDLENKPNISTPAAVKR